MTNERIAQLMREVQSDCRAEAEGLDGQPFTGRTVATQLGNMLAEMAAIARAVEILAGRVPE